VRVLKALAFGSFGRPIVVALPFLAKGDNGVTTANYDGIILWSASPPEPSEKVSKVAAFVSPCFFFLLIVYTFFLSLKFWPIHENSNIRIINHLLLTFDIWGGAFDPHIY
tara:strand:- start:328 stop:657 length:330 start_codon:yes stop_codon:yes gene_type:complete